MQRLIIALILVLLLACNESIKNQSNTHQPVSISNNTISNQNISCDSLLNEILKSGQGKFGQTGTIPDNFEKSLEQLDLAFDDGSRIWIKCLPDGGLDSLTHGGPGMVVKYSWELTKGSKLAKDLISRGLTDPDDMVTIILTSYQRKLKNESIRFTDQVRKLSVKE